MRPSNRMSSTSGAFLASASERLRAVARQGMAARCAGVARSRAEGAIHYIGRRSGRRRPHACGAWRAGSGGCGRDPTSFDIDQSVRAAAPAASAPMNPFAVLLDQSIALSAHSKRLATLPSRVVQPLSRPPRVAPDELAARYDALVDSQAASREAREQRRAAKRRTAEATAPA